MIDYLTHNEGDAETEQDIATLHLVGFREEIKGMSLYAVCEGSNSP